MVKIGTCNQRHCHPDSDCVLGEPSPSDCKHWGTDTDESIPSIVENGRGSVPWSGSALGLDDVRLIAAREKPKVIAIIGPHNAGKTTYLAALHLSISRAQIVPDICFAGSYTIAGWERVADFMRYPKNEDPTYPPHTPLSNERSPGLLHYAFRIDERSVKDVVFTDAPGEWFTSWAVSGDTTQYPGAAWTIKHADAFFFFVDRESLIGSSRGVARNQISMLAGRVSQELRGRPLAIVWAKSDISIDKQIESDVNDVLNRNFPDALQFNTSFQPTDGNSTGSTSIAASFRFAITSNTSSPNFSCDFKIELPTDRFFAYQGAS